MNKPDTELTLHFTSDSWAEVYDATGKRLFADVGAASSVRTVRGKAPLRVMLGNGPGVGVDINGHRTAIESTTRDDGSARFTVQKDGRLVKSRSN
jgi:cytoskeleton protein RodZ